MGRVVRRESGKLQDSQKASSVSSLSSGHPLFPPHTHCSEAIQSIVVHPTAPSYQWGDPHFLPNIQCECHCILLPNLICSTCLSLSPPCLSILTFLFSPPLPSFPSPSLSIRPLLSSPHFRCLLQSTRCQQVQGSESPQRAKGGVERSERAYCTVEKW